MCFDASAAPPPAPVTGRAAATDRLTLTAADGNRFAATFATARDTTTGVVVLPDVRGLHRYYEQLAEALAGAGVHALAIDFYGRTGGAEWRDDDFDFAPHRADATDATIATDVDAAMKRLREEGADIVFTLGFCMGGRAALLQATRDDLSGAVGFYAWPARESDGGSPIGLARQGRIRAPVLALYGGADEKITAEHRESFDSALAQAGVSHESVTYDGAPHSFFDRRMADHAEACQDAWQRVLRFMGVLAT